MRERDTAELSVSEIATRAGVSRQVVYLHYGDRNQLLIDAAVELPTREFVNNLGALRGPMFRDVLLLTRHFDDDREFYRVMLDGPCSYELNRELILLQPFNTDAVRFLLGDDVDDEMVESLSAFLTGGFKRLISSWVTSRQPGLPGPRAMVHWTAAQLDWLRVTLGSALCLSHMRNLLPSRL